MNAHRRFRISERWTIGTMLIFVVWCSVVVWLNIRPDPNREIDWSKTGRGLGAQKVRYGFPFVYAGQFHIYYRQNPVRAEFPPGLARYYYRALAGNILVGLLAATVLTWASSYLLRRVTSKLASPGRKHHPTRLPNSAIMYLAMDTSPDSIEARENSLDGPEQVMSDKPARKRRWFRFSPDRFIVGLLAVEVFLFLSEHFEWFAFNEQKGWTVLIAVAAVCLAVIVLLLWLGVSVLYRWRFQFSVRSLVVLVVVVAIPCSWFAVKMRQAERQRKAVEAIVLAGGQVWLGCDRTDGFGRPIDRPAPAWLEGLMGVDFFSDVASVYLCSFAYDETLEGLKVFPSNTSLEIDNFPVSIAGLEHIKGMTQLQYLGLYRTRLSANRIRELEEALPNCEIQWIPNTNNQP